MEIPALKHIKNKFYTLETRQDVSELLGIEDRSLRYFLFKRRPENLYYKFRIPKGMDGFREINAPKDELKTIQRKLANILNEVYEAKICAYGFIPGKDIIQNARSHVGRNLVLNIDLKDFFIQIHFGRIRGMLMNPPYSLGREAATTIAQIACLNGTLPQGAPTSPVLSNMICAPLDNSLMKLAKKTKCTYTRYADDLTFSTHRKEMDKALVYFDNNNDVVLGAGILSLLRKHSFKVNPDKIAFRTRYDRQEVTGLTVNVFPNVRRSYIKQLRAILHKCKKDGVYSTAKEYAIKRQIKNRVWFVNHADSSQKKELINWFRQVLIGKINFIGQVKGKDSFTFLSFAKQFNALFSESYFDISLLLSTEELVVQNTFILEDANSGLQGTGIFLPDIGLLTCNHLVDRDDFFEVIYIDNDSEITLTNVCKSMNAIYSNYDIDFSIFQIPNSYTVPNTLKIGDSTNLKMGDKVIIGGYPQHATGNTPHIQTCEITSIRNYHGSKLYTVSGQVVHGSSGGLVLNGNLELIGMIKAGVSGITSESASVNHGFIPIHLVLDYVIARD